MMKLQQAIMSNATRTRRAAILATSLVILISILISAHSTAAQSTKGQTSTRQSNTNGVGGYSAPANIGQSRQQQQQSYATPLTRSSPTAAVTAKRRSQQREEPAQQAPTEDPLSDSEPALYGSVAGQPGVDFPGYTRIPKTSFTCEGKGFDFGFYADEEAGCQVYHVCWSGRRESFLCGVGTVFNQAILACDYWHSVDCSKSSQFYGVNSELGKAGAEPAVGGSQRTQPARTQATLPGSSPSSSSSSSLGYGDNLNQKRTNQQQPQYNTNQNSDDSNFDVPQQQQLAELAPTQIQQQQQQPSYGAKNDIRQQQQQQTSGYQTPTFALQRNQPIEYQQRADTKTNQRAPTTTLATPAAKRPRFNMDFNQKVNSLIESPVRPPIKGSAPIKQRQQQRPANLAQLAVSRAQQSGSQSLNPGPARKVNANGGQIYQQKQTYAVDAADEPQVIQQQQQQSFDDSPVQTSTSSSGNYAANRQTTPTNSNNFGPQQQQLVVQSGGGPDGSSAITSQYDTLSPAGGSSANDQSYESSLDDSSSNPNDDFRSSGAKAAASHNQNWYIMRSI